MLLLLVSIFKEFYMQEKVIKQKLQDEVAKAIIENSGAPLSISEHEAVVSKIKIDAARAHAEILEAMGAVPKSMFSSQYLYLQC